MVCQYHVQHECVLCRRGGKGEGEGRGGEGEGGEERGGEGKGGGGEGEGREGRGRGRRGKWDVIERNEK